MKIPEPRKLPSGNWFIQLRINGESISITDSDKKRCVARAAEIKSGMKAPPEKRKSVTLEHAIDEYIDRNYNLFSPNTRRGYEIIKRNRFPTLMKKDCCTISKQDVQRAVNEEVVRIGKNGKPASPKTILNAFGLIRPVLKEYGVEVDGIHLPQRKKVQKDYLSANQIAALITAAKDDECGCEITMAAWLGLRRSEICGLMWDCVDFGKRTITIKRTLVQDENCKWVIVDRTKNEGSQRTILAPEYILSMLRERRKSQDGRVFHSHPDTIRKHANALCRKCGFPEVAVHGLRHANAAVMVSLGIVDRVAMARGGWTTENTFKDIYAYLFPEDQQNADDKINQYFEGMLTWNREI